MAVSPGGSWAEGSADPAGVGLAAGAAAVARARADGVAGDGGGQGTHDPRVDRQPLAGGGLLDAGLEVLGEPEVDASGRSLVGLRRRERLGLVRRLRAGVGRGGGGGEL